MKIPTESLGGKVAGLLVLRGALSLRFFGKGLIRIKLFLVYFIIQSIRLYQRIVSLRFAPSCRFYPSCSHYFIQAISYFGLFKGIRRGFFRILRCNPLFLGGYDPVIEPVTGDKNNPPFLKNAN